MTRQGLTHIYTGTGKGKTTAAVGLICRAVGHNLKCGYVSFHKDPDVWGYGELRTLRQLGVDVYVFARAHPHFNRQVAKEELQSQCRQALAHLRTLFRETRHDLLVLDEILISVRDGFLSEDDVVELIKSKPRELELVLTGRDASANLIAQADLVSTVEETKHPYEHGTSSREGIEY